MISCQSHLFNIPADITYLNCAYLSPQLRSVSEAGHISVASKEHPWQLTAADFFTQTEKTILGLDAESGELLWKQEWINKYAVHANTPLYHKGQVFIASGYGKGGIMLKLSDDGKSINKLWTNADINHKSGGFVMLDEKIYGAVDRGMDWHCIDWNTGETLYSSSIFKSGNIVSAEGLLYLYSEGGEVALVEPTENNFNILGKFRVPYGEKQHWAHLVIKNKRLYVRHGSSLMVYSIGN